MPTTPIFIINDMLSSLPIEKCSELFCYLEDNSQVLKSVFFSSIKKLKIKLNLLNLKTKGFILFKRKKLFTSNV